MRLSLSARISLAIVGVLTLAIFSSAVAIISAFRFAAFQDTLVEDNLASVRAAEELEIALLTQRGQVAHYMLDRGNREWLEHLRKRGGEFQHWLEKARQSARTAEEHRILDRLARVHGEYAGRREAAVNLFDAGETDEAKRVLLTDVALLYDQAYDLCERFIAVNQRRVDAASADVRLQVEQVTVVVTVSSALTVCLGLGLLWLFFQGVLFPLRRLAEDARQATGSQAGRSQRDELRELGRYMQLLMADVAETRTDLAASRTKLAQAEKLTAVGKLAASVAHEIRNPLTSIKMWLFALRRLVGENAGARQKLEIVADEVVRLGGIVRQFLEFSRPPQLCLAPHNVWKVLDHTLDVVRHRFEQHRIEVRRQAAAELPDVAADAEQLEQVFLNLIINSIEAMPAGGRLELSCAAARRNGDEMLSVVVSDTGEGMSAEVRERVFEPFFTTKSTGTGLGLCIAASIMAGHGGGLVLDSTSPQGTRWTVWIPLASAK